MLLSLLSVVGTNQKIFAAEMGHSEKAAIVNACESLVLDYAYYRDRPDADGVANLFTKGGTFEILGETFKGRQRIHERITAGLDGPVFRHLMSTIRIFPLSPDRARGVSYVTVYAAPKGRGPQAVKGIMGIGEYHDEFVRTGEGWKIDRRMYVPVFTSPE